MIEIVTTLFNVTVRGKGYAVEVQKNGTLHADVNGSDQWGWSIAEVHEAIENELQRIEKRKNRRSERRAAMPISAVHSRSGRRLTVRGVDKRSGYALVTAPDGDKTSLPWDVLLRDLTKKENEELKALRAREDAQRKVVAEMRARTGWHYARSETFDAKVYIDAERKVWMSEINGTIFEDNTYTLLCRQIQTAILMERFPYTLGDIGVVKTTKENVFSTNPIFATFQEAEKAFDESEALAAITRQIRVFNEDHAFPRDDYPWLADGED